MAQATFSIRMDETLKEQFDLLCNEFGMNMTTAINVFARTVVRQRKIPFEIAAPEITREGALQVFTELRNQSKINFPSGMSIEEIDDEIRRARGLEED